MTVWKLWFVGEQSRMNPSCWEHECLRNITMILRLDCNIFSVTVVGVEVGLDETLRGLAIFWVKTLSKHSAPSMSVVSVKPLCCIQIVVFDTDLA